VSIDAPPPPPPPPPPRDEPVADQVDLPIMEDATALQDTGSPSERPGNTDSGSAPLSPATDARPGQTVDRETQGSSAFNPDTSPADPVDQPIIDDATIATAPQEVEEPASADTWGEASPGQDASPSLSQEMADTPAASVGPTPEASPGSLGPDAPTATDPLQLSDGSAEQPQSVTETAAIVGDGADTRPTDERMFSDMNVHQALNRENDNLKGDGPQLQADTLTGLPPDASIVEGGYVYGTDSLGRVTQAYAAKLELEPGIRTRSELTSARELGQPGDDAGHLIAARFGGSDSVWNLAPQDSNLNRGVWNQMETVWSNAIEIGDELSINVMANYVGEEMRPASYTVQYWINGELQPTVSFQNRRRGD
jgi:DNA/RNA non-specific endonuclease